MKLQILGSGSRGNAALLWAGETLVLIDAGLPIRTLNSRLDGARIGHRAIDHVLVSHGHLDHSRSAGIIAKRHGATLHCAAKIQLHRSLCRAPDKKDLPIGGTTVLEGRGPLGTSLRVTTTKVPHDCEPTVAFGIEQSGRKLSLISDMGEPREDVAKVLHDPHVLMLEANYDLDMLMSGPYPQSLRERVQGSGGHLSNEQMAVMLTRVAGPKLHTVYLIHLSEKNNTSVLARAAAETALQRMGRDNVEVITALQHEPLAPIQV